jgi:hypothetical protein
MVPFGLGMGLMAGMLISPFSVYQRRAGADIFITLIAC